MAKQNPIPSCNRHHLSDLEYIIMIREKGTYFAPHLKDTPIDDYRKFYLTTCSKGIHPAQKPVDLIRRFISLSSQEGDLVLDPFTGSGTTAIACQEENRNFIGFEKDEKYYNLASERIFSNQVLFHTC